MTATWPEPDPFADPTGLWWSTYNAAISGASGNSTLQYLGFDGLHEFAERLADRAHGTLKPLSTQAARQVPEVQALVDAAQRLLDAYASHDTAADTDLVQLLQFVRQLDARIGPLGNALKPFQLETTEHTP